jgi:S-adenosylmethionine synthetase
VRTIPQLSKMGLRVAPKSVVASGLARRCEVRAAYVIGVAGPVSVDIDTFGTATIDEKEIMDLIEERFYLGSAEIIHQLWLRQPMYLQTATYGHFARGDIALPWEQALDPRGSRSQVADRSLMTP